MTIGLRLIAGTSARPLRKVTKCIDSGYEWTLTLECGHVVYQEHAVYGVKKLKAPKSKRCWNCPTTAGGKA